jgi:chromosome segregation ATPase
MTQLIINKGGVMINLTTILRNGERVMRMVPVVKELLPDTSNELGHKSQIGDLEDAVHNKNAEIFKLRQERKAMKRLLFSNNKKITDLEDNVENCNYQINILQNALTKGE